MLIVFCGIDGAGKTTQVNLLQEHFKSFYGNDPIVLKQPTDWFRQNKLVRQRLNQADANVDVRFLSLFSAADRMLQIVTEIQPALDEGKVVIMDRYVYSAYAYMYARGLRDFDWIKEINKFAIEPDIVFYLDVCPKEALRRVVERDGQSEKKEEQNMEIMEAVRARFLQLSDEFNIQVLDGRKSYDTLHEEIVELIASKIQIRRPSFAN